MRTLIGKKKNHAPSESKTKKKRVLSIFATLPL